MNKGKKINWMQEEKELVEMDQRGTLDESDAHLYE